MKKQFDTFVRLCRFLPVLVLAAHTAGGSAKNITGTAPDIRNTPAYIRWLSTSHSTKAVALRGSLATVAADLKASKARAKRVGIDLETPKMSTADFAGNSAPLLAAWQKARAGMPLIPEVGFHLNATDHYSNDEISSMRDAVAANGRYDDLLYSAAQMPYRVFTKRGPQGLSIWEAMRLLNIEAYLYAKDGNYPKSVQCVQLFADLASQTSPTPLSPIFRHAMFQTYESNFAMTPMVLAASRSLLTFAGPNETVTKTVQGIVDKLAICRDLKWATTVQTVEMFGGFAGLGSLSPSESDVTLRQYFKYQGLVSSDKTLTSAEKRLSDSMVDREESNYLDNAAAIAEACAESGDKCESVTSDVESKLASSQDPTDPTFITVQFQYMPILSMQTQVKRISANSLITKAAAYALGMKATTGKYPVSLPAELLGHAPYVVHYSIVGDHQITVGATIHLTKEESHFNPSTVADFVYKD